MLSAKPIRLRLSRAKGFDLQAASRTANGLAAVKVDRSTGFGNPFPVAKGTSTSMGKTKDVWFVGSWSSPAMWIKDLKEEASDLSVKAFSAWLDGSPAGRAMRDNARALRGKNLACWCALSHDPYTPCHADVLLSIANAIPMEAIINENIRRAKGQTL